MVGPGKGPKFWFQNLHTRFGATAVGDKKTGGSDNELKIIVVIATERDMIFLNSLIILIIRSVESVAGAV